MKTAVIKYGGAAMQTAALMEAVMEDMAQLHTLGIQPILVHGGGPEISHMCQRLGIVSKFVDGLRVTDKETMQVAQMVLIGKINIELVAHLNRKGIKAIGLSGQDGNLLVARQKNHPSGVDLGYVGEIEEVNAEVLQRLMQASYVPVIAPVATSRESVFYNINADSAASHIAMSLQADHLIFLSDVPGILSNANDPTSKIDTILSRDALNLIDGGHITGGMIPKTKEAVAALNKGVKEVHILDGTVRHALLQHLKKTKQMGTTFK